MDSCRGASAEETRAGVADAGERGQQEGCKVESVSAIGELFWELLPLVVESLGSFRLSSLILGCMINLDFNIFNMNT